MVMAARVYEVPMMKPEKSLLFGGADHVCDELCSGRVTDEKLGELGFPVEKTDKIVGTPIVVREGMKRHHAVHAAFLEGKVRLCSK